jgi:hypothetical protein
MVTQRIANPFIPVRFWTWPPHLYCFCKKNLYCGRNSSIAQLVEQLTVNQLVAGSSPARGAKKNYIAFFIENLAFKVSSSLFLSSLSNSFNVFKIKEKLKEFAVSLFFSTPSS